jgi:hypothetical protein
MLKRIDGCEAVGAGEARKAIRMPCAGRGGAEARGAAVRGVIARNGVDGSGLLEEVARVGVESKCYQS